MPQGVVLKGIAGSPGVAVGSALVVGDTRTTYARRHVSQAQIEGEIERLMRAVEDAKRHLREVSARLPSGPLETSAILDAYLTMMGDPMLLDRVTKKIKTRRSAPSGRSRRPPTRSGSSSRPSTRTSATPTSPSAATTSSSCATGCSASSRAT